MTKIESSLIDKFGERVSERRIDVEIDVGPVDKKSALGQDSYHQRRNHRVQSIAVARSRFDFEEDDFFRCSRCDELVLKLNERF